MKTIQATLLVSALALLGGCMAVPVAPDYYAAPTGYYAAPPLYYAAPPLYYAPAPVYYAPQVYVGTSIRAGGHAGRRGHGRGGGRGRR